MKTPRAAVSFRLSETARRLLARLAGAQGVSRTAVLEHLIRREARRLRISTADRPSEGKEDERAPD